MARTLELIDSVQAAAINAATTKQCLYCKSERPKAASTCRFCEERYINCRRGRNGPLCYRLLPTEPLNEQAIKILSEMSVRVTKLARKIGSMASLCFRSGIVTLSISTDALDADEFAAADAWSNAMARAIRTGNENEVSVGRRGRTRTCDPQLRRLMLYPPELRAPLYRF